MQKRLIRAMKRGELRVQDLARWFGRPYPTVYGWVNFGHAPEADIEKSLTALERAIDKGRFPLDRMTPKARKLRIRELRIGLVS